MRRLIHTSLAALLVSPLAARQGEEAGADTRLPGVVHARPDAEGTPTPVTIGLYVVDITAVSDVNQSFTADFALWVSWRDPRLARPGGGVRVFALDEIWRPNVLVLNQRRLFKSFADTVEVDPEGNCFRRQRYYGELSSRFDLRDFPVDSQQVSVSLICGGHRVDQLRLEVDESATGRSDSFSVVHAEIGSGSIDVGEYYFAPGHVSLPSLTYTFEVERHADYYLWKILVPLAVIVAMSWMIFWIDPAHAGPQLSVSVTALLTVIAYRFLLGNLVPRIAYLTRLDYFTLGTTLIVFLGLVVSVLTINLTSRERRDLALRIDGWCRFVFPVLFALIVYLSFMAG